MEVFDLDILPMSWATGLETATPEDKPPECRPPPPHPQIGSTGVILSENTI